MNAGGGINSLAFDGVSGSTVGGTLTYIGGPGADTLTVSGQNAFRLVARMGGGEDTVAFAPDARVGSALIDFGPATGTKTLLRGHTAELVRQPLKNRGQRSLDVCDCDIDHAIIASLEPASPLDAIGAHGLALIVRNEFDREPQRKRDEIRNLPPDRSLALELAGEAAIAGQRLPQQPLRVGRIPA